MAESPVNMERFRRDVKTAPTPLQLAQRKRDAGKPLDQNERALLGTLSADPFDGTRLMNPSFHRGDHAELADVLLDSIEANRALLVGAEADLWRYLGDSGIWVRRERDALRKIVKGFAGAPKGENGTLKITSGAADGAITLAYADVARSGFFDAPAPGVPMTNGFAAVENGKVVLRKHAPEHRARHGHAFPYDPKAPAAELHTFFDDVFADVSEDERAARIAFLQEHAGACLTGMATVYQTCALCIGNGGNGKSALLAALYRGALPDGTVASLPPQFWSERFQLARLVGVLANVVDELPETELISTGTFKSLVAGEPVHIEQKHRDPFEARIACGHVFSANALPATRDLSEGFFRRIGIVKFGRRFDNTEACDLNVASRVVAACRPGIVAFALEGAARLQRQGKYTVPECSTEAIEDWRRSSDSVALFVAERTKADTEHGTSAAEIYRRYKAWAAETGHQPVSARTFSSRMSAAGKFPMRRAAGVFYPVAMPDSTEARS